MRGVVVRCFSAILVKRHVSLNNGHFSEICSLRLNVLRQQNICAIIIVECNIPCSIFVSDRFFLKRIPSIRFTRHINNLSTLWVGKCARTSQIIYNHLAAS